MLLRLISAGAILVAALSALPSPAGAQDATVTGCLTQTGRLVNVAVGEEPARPCGPRQTQVSWRLAGDDDEGGPERVDFFLTMERDGPDETIATNGPLEVFARCYTEPFFGNDHHFEIKVTSDVDGWWVKGRNTPQAANEETLIFGVNTAISGYDGPRYFDGYERRSTHSALAPDGSYVAIEADTLSVNVNILGHDCIAVGSVILTQGALE